MSTPFRNMYIDYIGFEMFIHTSSMRPRNEKPLMATSPLFFLRPSVLSSGALNARYTTFGALEMNCV